MATTPITAPIHSTGSPVPRTATHSRRVRGRAECSSQHSTHAIPAVTSARSSRNGSASRYPSPRAAATAPLEHSNGACHLTQLTAPDAAVARGAADVAVVRGPVQAEGVQSRVLHREERAVVFSRDSVLNRVPRVAAGDLAGLHAVVNAQGGTTTAPWLEDTGPGEILTVSGVDEWIVAIAADPRRFGVTPASTMRYDNHPELVVRPGEGLGHVPVHLAWRAGEGSLAVTEFVRLVPERA